MSFRPTFDALQTVLTGWNQADLFDHRSDPEVEAARIRFNCRMARRRRREAIAPFLAEPWRAWTEDGDAAAIARRFLALFPDRDLPDPDYALLTDRQAAAEYHLEEERNDPHADEGPR